MRIKTTPQEIWNEYEKGVSYNQSQGVNLYETVRQNENFFIGRQWEGVNAPDLEKPVINILKRVVSFFISTIVSDDVSAQVSLFTGTPDPQTEILLKIVSSQFDQIIERCKLKARHRDIIRDAAVDGDSCLYMYFDPSDTRGGTITGNIEAEQIENTNIHFGNPQVWEVQKQPYLILSLRKTVEAVREEARENGMGDPQQITADDDPNGINTDQETGKVTVLIKFWKQDGIVYFTKTTQNVVIKKPTALGYRLYPIAYLSWEKVKNSFHGQSCITGLIPNQIFINKLFAMCMEHVKKMAFPKVVYNRQLLPKGWSNRVGEAIPVEGETGQNVAQIVGGADMSGQVINLIERIMEYTRDTMGASDAALGNVKPDNTSAIIAVQRSSEVPLELQRMAFYQFVEDYIRIFMDMMRVDYGIREVSYTDENGQTQTEYCDFSRLDDLYLKLNVEIGASAYWSELMQVQTLDNLFDRGIIQDAATYLESIPDGYIKNKQKLINQIRELQGGMENDGAVPLVPDGNLSGFGPGGAAGSQMPQPPVYPV